MTKPIRLQLSRRKGFNLQALSLATNGLPAVNVVRPGVWGNPFVIGEACGVFPKGEGLRGAAETLVSALTREQVIEFYRELLDGVTRPEFYPAGHRWQERFRKKIGGHPTEAVRHMLRAKNLACFCKLGDACHADVLLEVANR